MDEKHNFAIVIKIIFLKKPLILFHFIYFFLTFYSLENPKIARKSEKKNTIYNKTSVN